MLNNEPVIVFLATADAPSARNFYENQVGLEFVHEDEFALVFKVQDNELRIQKLPEVTPQKYTVLGWSVGSIETIVRELAKSGVMFERYAEMNQDDLGIWQSPSGARVAWFKDPDGNILSLTRNPTN